MSVADIGTTNKTNGINGYTLNRNPQGTDPFQQGSVYYATLNQSSVAPGSTGTFTLHLTAATAPGTYTESWHMSNPSSTFFGPTVTLSLSVAGTVTNYTLGKDFTT